MLVSVIVPTYNRLQRLKRVVAALEAQVADDFDIEIVVISDGSTDGTNEWLNREPRESVVVVCQDNAGAAAARNAGLDAASGELVVFIDDDVVPEPACVATHVAYFRSVDTPMVGIGPLLTPMVEQSPYVAWEQRMLEKQYEAMAAGRFEATARQFYTGNASCPRAVLLDSGGFSDRFRRAEDVELGYRLADQGVGFDFLPEAKAYHFAERSFDAWIDIASSYGRNDVLFGREGGQEWIVPRLREEFDRRHLLVRAFTRVGLVVPGVRPLLRRVAPVIIESSIMGRSRRVQQALLSALFNLEYFGALADELGGALAFLRTSKPDVDESTSEDETVG